MATDALIAVADGVIEDTERADDDEIEAPEEARIVEIKSALGIADGTA